MVLPKFAKAVDGVIDVISYYPDADDAEWFEVADHVFAGFIEGPGGEWLAPEPTSGPNPLSLPLDRLTFWLAAAEVGVSKWSVRDKIALMHPGVERDAATAWFEEARQYRRNDPLLIQLAAAEGISEPQLDALWLWALGDT